MKYFILFSLLFLSMSIGGGFGGGNFGGSGFGGGGFGGSGGFGGGARDIGGPRDIGSGRDIANRDVGSRDIDRSEFRTSTMNVNRNLNVHVHNHVYGYGHYGGWYGYAYYPAAAALTAAAVIGSIYYTLPANCATTYYGAVPYYHCGVTWYHPYYYGTTVQYEAVEDPSKTKQAQEEKKGKK
ncbi:MAG: hypothetical protein ACJ76H_17060 [Bacteriovoracaceae bacterium]